jgi:hypothetical protein
MSHPFVTRGYLFSRALLVTAGYEIKEVVKTQPGGGWRPERRTRGVYSGWDVFPSTERRTGMAITRVVAFGQPRVFTVVQHDAGTVCATVMVSGSPRVIESATRLRQLREDEELLLLNAA